MTVILIYLNNHIRNDAFSFCEVIERKKRSTDAVQTLLTHVRYVYTISMIIVDEKRRKTVI